MKKINLALNENHSTTFVSISSIKQVQQKYSRDLKMLQKMILERNKLKKAQCYVVNGIDEAIYICLQYLKSTNGTLLLDVPTYYGVLTSITSLGIPAIYCEQSCFKYNINKTIATLKDNPAITAVYLCNPINPTGEFIENLQYFISYCKEKKILCVVDEAYIEFVSNDFSLTNYCDEFDNLIVLRTFSKAYGLAGLRCGYLITKNCAIETICCQLMNCQPFHSSSYTIRCAIKAYFDENRMIRAVRKIETQRKKLCNILDSLNIKYLPSNTNFVCFTLRENTIEFIKFAYEKNLVLFSTEDALLENFCRVTIGTRAEINHFRKILLLYLSKNQSDTRT